MLSETLLEPFPEIEAPQKLFARNSEIQGTVNLGKLCRFSEYLFQDVNEVNDSKKLKDSTSMEVNLRFFKCEESGQNLVQGTINGHVLLQCQRCLGKVDWTLGLKIKVFVLKSESDSELLPRGEEWIQSDLNELNIYTLIEDELILGLPIAAYHEDKQCNADLLGLKASNESNEPGFSSINKSAFASLAALKQELNDGRKS